MAFRASKATTVIISLDVFNSGEICIGFISVKVPDIGVPKFPLCRTDGEEYLILLHLICI